MPRIIGIPIVAFVAALLYSGWPFPALKFLNSLIFVTVMWNGDYFIITRLRRIWPELEETPKRVLFSILFICIYNITADYIVCSSLYYTGLDDDLWLDEASGNILKNLMITAIVSTIYEAGYFFSKWKKQTIETEQLRSQQLRSELSVLKNQISPHFLFNSLNTLITLIHENQKQAVKFTEKLSEVYRYILQYKDEELVRLKTELDFSKSYIFLLKMRFEEGLNVEIDSSLDKRMKYVAPLTLQMLIENAVKHNVVSKSSPLTIEIYSENDRSLIVKNNLQPKPAEGHSTHTGIENIKSRYALLSDREVDVIRTKDHFMVALPLVKLETVKEEIPVIR